MGGGQCAECQNKKIGVGGRPLQTKLAISEPGDVYEQEADRVAEQVMRMSPADVSKRQKNGMTQPLVQRQASIGTTGLAEVPPIVHDVLNSPGFPLDVATRAFFELRFGHDFSQVRVHADTNDEQSARDVNAHAYTVGHNIVFGAGRFAPNTYDGDRLIAHELAHVAQQSYTPGNTLAVQRKGRRAVVGTHEVTVTVRYVDDSTELGHRLVARISKETGIPESALFQSMFSGVAERIHFMLARDHAVKVGGRVKVAVKVSYYPESSVVAAIELIEPARPLVQDEPGDRLQDQEHASPDVAEQPTPGETVEARLRRQARTIVRSMSEEIAAADRQGYDSMTITIEHTGKELIPGFQKRKRADTRPAGTVPISASEIAKEHLTPLLEMILMGPGRKSEIEFGRTETGRFDFLRYTSRRPVGELSNQELGQEYPDAVQLALSGNPERRNAIEDEIDRREEQGFGTAVPRGIKPSVPANTEVTPDVALKILDNVSKGEPPFRPELGKGGSSWVVTEGSPYVGIDPAKNINIEVEILKTKDVVVFGENELTEILEQESKSTAAEAEAKFRENFGLDKTAKLSNRLMKSLTRFQKRFAESRMWDRVGERVRASTGKVGEVVFKEGSRFSKTPGKFGVVADPAKVQVKGGIPKLMESLSKQGVSAEPVIVEAAEAMAKKLKWAGRVRGVFHYGGRVMIVVAIAADVYKIYHAKNKTRAVIESAGGWAGATAAGTAFAAWFAPADVAGPWAWAAHGVGTLVTGAIGYWVGSKITRTIYELVLEDEGVAIE
ncbi:MAG: DUF4157 domain-containing protein [Nitrospira sp.]|nr:DUF4157 domain-containing protein [Nitrospira sp.]